jgi:hypothetical protein
MAAETMAVESAVDFYHEKTRFKGIFGWMFSTDHKRIGLLYLVAVVMFFLVGMTLGLLMRLEMLKPEVDDASYGAALIGGVGVGVFKDERDAIQKCVKIASRNQPDMRNHEKYQRLFQIYKESQKRLAEINHQLHAFSES